MEKSPEAFRTISEVAETLETPAHVLRFWESRFPQIRPVKRAGGRRYYRPADVALLSGIRHLLHDEGMTIRGVQKILREQGVRHVAAMAVGAEAVEFDGEVLDGALLDGALLDGADMADGADDAAGPMSAQVFELDPAPRPPVPAEKAVGEVVRLRAAPMPVVEAPPVPTPPAQDAVPEAGHIWVDDEPELELSAPVNLFAAEPPAVHADPAPAAPFPAAPFPAAPFMDQAPEPHPKLSGVATRLRALPGPISPEALADLRELHSRLGLVQAQMAEALRQRR